MYPRGVEMYLFYLPTDSVRNLWIQSLSSSSTRSEKIKVRARAKCLSKFELNLLRSCHVKVCASNPRFPMERALSSRAPTRVLGAWWSLTRRRRNTQFVLMDGSRNPTVFAASSLAIAEEGVGCSPSTCAARAPRQMAGPAPLR